MSDAEFRCGDCGKRCVDANALFQHRKFKHKAKSADNPKPPSKFDDEISYAEIAIEAQRKQRAGEPLEDWEKPYAY